MKLILIILVSLIFINKVCSQHTYGKIIIEIEIDSGSVFTKADVTGAVPGGDKNEVEIKKEVVFYLLRIL
jgi:hypothetical protein